MGDNKHDLVKFPIPAPFILNRVWLMPDELAYGFRKEWLTSEDVVAIALAGLKAGIPQSEPEEALALLLQRDISAVPALIEDLEQLPHRDSDPSAVWLFLSLAWIEEHHSEFPEPFNTIDMLIADFGYPPEVLNLLTYMPPETGEPGGLEVLEVSRRTYLARKSSDYRERQRSQ